MQSLGDLNVKYKCMYGDRPLTEFEKKLFNTDYEPNLEELNLEDCDVLNSLSIYYDPKINPNFVELYLAALLKMDKLNDSRGPLRLGVYYKDVDPESCTKYTVRASELGSPYAKIN